MFEFRNCQPFMRKKPKKVADNSMKIHQKFIHYLNDKKIRRYEQTLSV